MNSLIWEKNLIVIQMIPYLNTLWWPSWSHAWIVVGTLHWSFFTSIKLASRLVQKKTSIIGTANRMREIPTEIRNSKNPRFFSKISTSNNATLTVFQRKPTWHLASGCFSFGRTWIDSRFYRLLQWHKIRSRHYWSNGSPVGWFSALAYALFVQFLKFSSN